MRGSRAFKLISSHRQGYRIRPTSASHSTAPLRVLKTQHGALRQEDGSRLPVDLIVQESPVVHASLGGSDSSRSLQRSHDVRRGGRDEGEEVPGAPPSL